MKQKRKSSATMALCSSGVVDTPKEFDWLDEVALEVLAQLVPIRDADSGDLPESCLTPIDWPKLTNEAYRAAAEMARARSTVVCEDAVSP